MQLLEPMMLTVLSEVSIGVWVSESGLIRDV